VIKLSGHQEAEIRRTLDTLPGYELFSHDMPLTNPADAYDQIEEAFMKSKFNR
jgi:hypothetical protein